MDIEKELDAFFDELEGRRIVKERDASLYPEGYESPEERKARILARNAKALDVATRRAAGWEDIMIFDLFSPPKWVRSNRNDGTQILYRFSWDEVYEQWRCNCPYREYNPTCKHEVARKKLIERREREREANEQYRDD